MSVASSATRLAFISAIALVSAVSSESGFAQTPLLQRAERPVLEAGETWTYEGIRETPDGNSVRFERKVAIESKGRGISVPGSRGRYIAFRDCMCYLVRILQTTVDGRTAEALEVLNEDLVYLYRYQGVITRAIVRTYLPSGGIFPLWVGKKLQIRQEFAYVTDPDFRQSHEHEYEVVSVEELNLPAGNLPAFYVRVRTQITEIGPLIRRRLNVTTSELWYATRAKTFVKSISLTHTGPDASPTLVEKTTLVLKAMNIAPP